VKNCIELIRVSTESQAADDRTGIPMQRAENRRTARAYGLEIVHTIEYADVSGSSVLLSPEMRELVERIASPEIHGVIAREFSRLMRPEDFGDYALLQSFVNTRTVLYLPDGCIDFATETGRLVGVLKAVIAGNERLEILRKLWSGKEIKRRAGGFPSTAICLPYGVSFDGAWHYTAKAERVREAFRKLLAGDYSYTELANFLSVSIAGLRCILQNPIYTGWRVIDKRRDPSLAAKRTKPDGRHADRPKIMRATEDVIRLKVIDEPLISESDFARAQMILDLNRKRNARTRNFGSQRYSYNGFLRCAACDELIYTHHRRHDYYACKGRKLLKTCRTPYMRRDLLDPALDRLFVERLSNEKFLRLAAKELLSRAEQPKRAGFEGEAARLSAKRSRVIDAYVEGTITSAERDARLKRIDGELSAVRVPQKIEPPADLKTLASVFRVFQGFDLLPREQKRVLLRACVSEIKVANYRVEGLNLLLPRGDECSLMDKDSSRRRA
jgi:DNA invertase Pin-like site-specific DNA recombinase